MRRIASPNSLRFAITLPIALLLLGLCKVGEAMERWLAWIDEGREEDNIFNDN